MIINTVIKCVVVKFDLFSTSSFIIATIKRLRRYLRITVENCPLTVIRRLYLQHMLSTTPR